MSARLRRATSAVVVAISLGIPGLAEACSVCMSGREDENRLAFIVTTIFMSVLPLAMIGGLGWYLRRRSRAIAEPGIPPAARPALGRATTSR